MGHWSGHQARRAQQGRQGGLHPGMARRHGPHEHHAHRSGRRGPRACQELRIWRGALGLDAKCRRTNMTRLFMTSVCNAFYSIDGTSDA